MRLLSFIVFTLNLTLYIYYYLFDVHSTNLNTFAAKNYCKSGTEKGERQIKGYEDCCRRTGYVQTPYK